MNRSMNTTRLTWVALALAALGVAGGCDKGASKPAVAAKSSEPGTPAVTPAPRAPAGPEPVLPEAVLRGLALDGDARARYFALLEQAPSPCGKAHGLRASLAEDPACKRAPFAARFLARMLAIGSSDDDALGLYTKRYLSKAPPEQFDLKGASVVGDPGAKVVLVEFFDYGCSHCKQFTPWIEKLEQAHAKELAVYFLNFPLGAWPTSEPAARAALAAHKQGKFAAFHHALFEAQGNQDETVVRRIAKEVGLDLAKFEADWKDPAAVALVAAQRAQGERVQLAQTPTIYLNGRLYIGAPEQDWLVEAVEEEIAVTAP